MNAEDTMAKASTAAADSGKAPASQRRRMPSLFYRICRIAI